VIPTDAGYSYEQIIEGIQRGEIRGLWIVATNPAHSWIQQSQCREILDKLDFLVVQDMYPTTETAELADLYLPAAAWGEKDGTFINSERRLGLLKKVSRAPGQALSDDISGIKDYRMLDERGGIQWPYPEHDHDDTPQRRLFADGRFYHPDGKAKLIFDHPLPMPEPTSEEFPLVLMTGRGSAATWHTQTRTKKSKVLVQLGDKDPFVEIHPVDADLLGFDHQQLVTIESPRGRMTAKARITPTVGRGRVFIPMHYEAVNRLTLAHFDPYSKQPSYKDCAVRISPA